MTGGAVRIKCGKVSRLLSVFEGIQGPKYFFSNGLLEPIPCATRVNWNNFFFFCIFFRRGCYNFDKEGFP